MRLWCCNAVIIHRNDSWSLTGSAGCTKLKGSHFIGHDYVIGFSNWAFETQLQRSLTLAISSVIGWPLEITGMVLLYMREILPVSKFDITTVESTWWLIIIAAKEEECTNSLIIVFMVNIIHLYLECQVTVFICGYILQLCNCVPIKPFV